MRFLVACLFLAACAPVTDETSGTSASSSSVNACAHGAHGQGLAYDVSRSKLAFGSVPKFREEFGMKKWIGANAVVAIGANGAVFGSLNSDAPEIGTPDWSADADVYGAHVRAYLTSHGIADCQVHSLRASYSYFQTREGLTLINTTIGLVRAIDGVLVPESNAYAHLNRDDRATQEGFFWPAFSEGTLATTFAFRDRLRDSNALAAYRATLPEWARELEGAVRIHHTISGLVDAPLRVLPTWDVFFDGAVVGSFDEAGTFVDVTAL